MKDGGLFDIGTDFARYIDSLFENTKITFDIDKTDAALFQKYGWTLDYEISEQKTSSMTSALYPLLIPMPIILHTTTSFQRILALT